MYSNLAIIAAFAFAYSLVAARLGRSPWSGPIIFLIFGFVAGPDVLGLVDLEAGGEPIKVLAELTLALVLFTDAARADMSVLKSSLHLPLRLLLLGLPLTIGLGLLFGKLVFDNIPVLELALLATILAPTDAALGKPVVSNKEVPAPVRQALNVESGLNDGICVPVLLIILAFAVGVEGANPPLTLILHKFAAEIGIGAGVGIILTLGATVLFRRAIAHDWISKVWMQVTLPAFTLTNFATAQCLGGSGFIACFVGGLVGGMLMTNHKEPLLTAAEGTGETLALLTWVVFGTVAVGSGVRHFMWQALVYAALSLTVIRMLPVFLSLSRTGLSTFDKLFMGWFGPRGLASIVFMVIVLGEDLPAKETLLQTVIWTVVISIFAHGLTANSLVRRYRI